MEIAKALDYIRSRRKGVLTTLRKDGRPQQSNIMFHLGDDDVIRISITADRAKYTNLVREPWAALHVTQDDFWAYAVVEGAVTLSAVVAATEDEAAEELVALYRNLAGEHENWAEYRQALVDDKRLVVRIVPNHAYGMLPNDAT